MVINAPRKLFGFVILYVCLSGASYGDAWKLYASYPTPGPNPRGYSGHGTAGYIVMDGPNPYVYRYSWEQGSIRWSFPAPGGPGAWGIYYYNPTFYVTNNRTSWIYTTTKQGSIISSFLCPFDGPADLDYRGSFPPCLHVAIPDRNIIALVDKDTGSLVRTIPGPGRRPTGCCGYAHLYVADAATHTVYENGVPIVTGMQKPVGLGYAAVTAPPYDIDLFVVDDATDYFYVYFNVTGVEPASLGRVKALFK